MVKSSKIYHDTLKLQECCAITPALTNDVLEKLKQDLVKSTECLNDLASREDFNRIVIEYAHGKKAYGKNTQEARDLYLKVLNQDLLPQEQRRRILDMTTSRIKEALPALASQYWINTLIQLNPDYTDKQITTLYYELITLNLIPPYLPKITTNLTRKIRAHTKKNTDTQHNTITFKPKLPSSRADNQYMTVKRHNNHSQIILNVAFKHSKRAELIFNIPNIDRYRTGKICKPDLVLDDNGRLTFIFAIEHAAPQEYEPECILGIDLGVVYPYVAAFVSDNAHSQPFYPGERIMDKVDLINCLMEQRSRLLRDIEEDERPGRPERYGTIAARKRVEVARINDRVSCLKDCVCGLVAHDVCELAVSSRAGIALERLSWSTSSHSFYYKMLQDAIVSVAGRCGVPVVFVSAAFTSSSCPFDGGGLVTGVSHAPGTRVGGSRPARGTGGVPVSRGVVCGSCGGGSHSRSGSRDRDGVACLNIGVRGFRELCGELVYCSRRQVRARRGFCWGGAPSLPAAVTAASAAPVRYSVGSNKSVPPEAG